MARGKWVVRVALFVALVWTLAGMTMMVSSATGIGVTLRPAATGWTSTWAVPVQRSGTSFQGQTLRQIVHTTVGGSTARIELSNAFGTRPLVITDVHIAGSGSGSSVNAGTDHGVTFGGATTTTIPVGGSVASDPIPFQVGPRSDVAISTYLPQATGPATSDLSGSASNYVAQGDVSAVANIAAARGLDCYYFLTSLDVRNTTA